MENNLKFNSAICTSRSQSERLLGVGLKKETADMRWERISEKYAYYPSTKTPYVSSDIPAWSLHRMIEMIQEVCPQVVIIFHRVDIRSNVKRIAYSFDFWDNLYDNLIDCIDWLIKEGYFNKEYLV